MLLAATVSCWMWMTPAGASSDRRADTSDLMALALGALAAAVNAPLEEFAWRGAYLSVAPRNPLVQGLGVWIFGKDFRSIRI